MKMTIELYNKMVEQMQHELENAYVYSNIESVLRFKGLENLAKHFKHQHDEEDGHANMLFDYLNDRNELVVFPNVNSIDVSTMTIKELFDFYVKREQETTARIEEVIKQAMADGDMLSKKFLMDFVSLQREEEATSQTLYDQIVMSGLCDNMALLMLFNAEYDAEDE